MMELFVTVILLRPTVTGAQGSQLEGPQNTLSVVGSNVTLKCLSPSRNCTGIEWSKYSAGSSVTVFNHLGKISSAHKERYTVDNFSSGCNLIIKNVQLTDAGRFICRALISSNTVEKTADLIILDSHPKCTTNASMDGMVEGNGLQLNCEVTYNGTNKASMVWEGVEDTSTAVKNETGKAISRSHFFFASAPEVPSFTCITSFTVETTVYGATIAGLATNTPNTTCETPIVKVLYYKDSLTATTTISVAIGVAVGFFVLIILLIICFCVRVCPEYKCCHSGNNSQDLTKGRMNGCPLLRNQMREEQPLPENPDTCIYSVVNKQQNAHLKTKPSLASTSESPNLPQGATLQARPRTDNSQSGHTNAYQHEEVTYADLAMEFGPREVVPNNNPVPEETLYAAVGTA